MIKSKIRIKTLAPLFLLFSAFLAMATGPSSQTAVLTPKEAEKEGRALVEEILSLVPTQSITNQGVLKIRKAKGAWTEIPVRIQTIPPAPNSQDWQNRYETTAPGNRVELAVARTPLGPNTYSLAENGKTRALAGNETMIPFAGSDFWIADLGLEFFHWPEQHLLKKELRRSRACRVLESINPQPALGAYSRVVSWIDEESNGIVFAEAYDAQGAKMKEFLPKDFKKVNGQWQLDEMEMDNVQTGSRTRIEFSLDR